MVIVAGSSDHALGRTCEKEGRGKRKDQEKRNLPKSGGDTEKVA